MQKNIRQMAYSHGRTTSWIHLIESEESARHAASIASQTLVAHGVNYKGLVTYGQSTIYANAWMVTINYPGAGEVNEQSVAAARAALDAAFREVKLVDTYTYRYR